MLFSCSCYFDFGTETAFRGFWFGDGRCSCLFDNARTTDPRLPSFTIGSQEFYHDGTGKVASSSNDGNNFVCFAFVGADGPTPMPTTPPTSYPTNLDVKSLYHYVGSGDCVDQKGESYDYIEAQLDFEECGLKCDEVYGSAVAFVGFSWFDEIDGVSHVESRLLSLRVLIATILLIILATLMYATSAIVDLTMNAPNRTRSWSRLSYSLFFWL